MKICNEKSASQTSNSGKQCRERDENMAFMFVSVHTDRVFLSAGVLRPSNEAESGRLNHMLHV